MSEAKPLDARTLPRSGVAGPMPWIVAIMMALATLAGAASLGLAAVAGALRSGNSITVQIVNADRSAREAEAQATLALLNQAPALRDIRRVPEAEVEEMLAPWLGEVSGSGIPLPAIIEAERRPGAGMKPLADALAEKAPSARVMTSEEWLAPLANLVAALRWLAAGILVLMLAAEGAVVALSARAALETHRATVDLLHMMGATDGQVARLVQRRVGGDMLWGSAVGAGSAFLLLILLSDRIAALGSGLLGPSLALGSGWLFLALIPVAATALAMLVARLTVFRALKTSL